MERNILLTIEYDGTGFCGWQRQPSQRTVQGELERVLSLLCKEEIQLNGVSRTDAGVHALAYKASFTGDFGIPTERIPYAANNILSESSQKRGDIRIISAEDVSAEFHARFSAEGKRYVYRIYNGREMSVFRRNYCYQVEASLDVEAMKKAASFIVGTHDFACFQAAGGQPGLSTVRTVSAVDIVICDNPQNPEADDGILREIEIHVSGDGFLYNMVRIITGTLVEVGLGRMEPEEVSAIIESRDRRRAGHTAPPQGLYLAEVFYSDMNKEI